jgi:hypothetical protein
MSPRGPHVACTCRLPVLAPGESVARKSPRIFRGTLAVITYSPSYWDDHFTDEGDRHDLDRADRRAGHRTQPAGRR